MGVRLNDEINSRLATIVLAIDPLGAPLLLHVQAVLALGLPFLDAHFLKENVGTVKDGGLRARQSAFGLPEPGELHALERLFGATGALELRVDVAAELGLRDAGLLEVGVDLPPDLIA